MRFTVGGRPLELSAEQVIRVMKGKEPEVIREHVVELQDMAFPPKQVLAEVTGWQRQSFTTMEAQRVLTRLGFICRRASDPPDGERSWVMVAPDSSEEVSADQQLAALKAAVATAQAAIAGLHARVTLLEAAGAAAL